MKDKMVARRNRGSEMNDVFGHAAVGSQLCLPYSVIPTKRNIQKYLFG